MRYIVLDPKDKKKITGHFANPHPHLKTIEVEDDDPRIAAFEDWQQQLKQEGVARRGKQNQLLERINKLEARVTALERQ